MTENRFYIKSTINETIAALYDLHPNEYAQADELLLNLKKINDKESLFKFIINEYFKEDVPEKINIINYIITNIFDLDKLKELLWELLKSRNYNDNTQSKIIELIKSLGDYVNYDEYIKYFDNPDAVIDSDTEKLLSTATFNPEAQIDFLDFISTLNNEDWRLMLASLSDDFQGDNLANVFIPLVYSNLNNNEKLLYLIEMLAKTSSPLAIKAFEDIIEYCDDETAKKTAKKELNILKLKGKNNAQANDFYVSSLNNSEFFEAYVGYPDGHGNQCIIFTRKANNTYQNFCAVIRDLEKVVDCFGFYELSENEYQRILKRFIHSQRLIKVEENVVWAIVETAIAKSLKNKYKIPYEILCWQTCLYDTKDKFSIIAKLNEALNDKYNVFKFDDAAFSAFDTWFYDENDPCFADSLNIVNFTQDAKTCVENFLRLLVENAEKYNIKQTVISRLKIMSFFMTLCSNKHLISVIAALNSDSEYKKLETYMLKHTIYEYFLRERENINSKNIANIFTRKNDIKNKKFSSEQINECIKYIEGNW